MHLAYNSRIPLRQIINFVVSHSSSRCGELRLRVTMNRYVIQFSSASTAGQHSNLDAALLLISNNSSGLFKKKKKKQKNQVLVILVTEHQRC